MISPETSDLMFAAVADAGEENLIRDLDDLELLGLIATQAALSLALLRPTGNGTSMVPSMDSLLAHLSEHTVPDSHDPLGVMLPGLSAERLDRKARRAWKSWEAS